jgi:hypothetical protein
MEAMAASRRRNSNLNSPMIFAKSIFCTYNFESAEIGVKGFNVASACSCERSP